jgi:hypothetical protein
MKTINKITAAAFTLALMTFVACEDPDVPDEGDVREKYVASWTCTEVGGMPPYTVTISLDPSNSSQVLLGNFHYFGAGEHAKAIATANNLTIPSQELCANTISGSGTLTTTTKITMKYYVNNHSTIDTVNATYTK